MNFSITHFALPGGTISEYRFEEPRDINMIRLSFKESAPDEISLSYLMNTWPQNRVENCAPMDNPFSFGWFPIDDHYNTKWRKAAVNVDKTGPQTAEITFKGLSEEFPECADYDVEFRRTLGILISAEGIEKVEIFTESPNEESQIRVAVDSPKLTNIEFSTYNVEIKAINPISGARLEDSRLIVNDGRCEFSLEIEHMAPAHQFSGDEGHITFVLNDDIFTISLESLERQGPIWFEEMGFFITLADDKTTLESYKSQIQDKKTISEKVLAHHEQAFGNAFHGQPRPHSVAYTIGCKHARQRFWIEPYGDIILMKNNVCLVTGKDTSRFKNEGDARFFFDLGKWCSTGRFADPSPIIGYNINLRNGNLALEQKSFAVPLNKPMTADLVGDDSITAMVRFRLRNFGDTPMIAELPMNYSQNSRRSYNGMASRGFSPEEQDENLTPLSKRDDLKLSANGLITSAHDGESALRCSFESDMEAMEDGVGIKFRKTLQPGESCEVLLKIPFIAFDSPEELQALEALDFDTLHKQVCEFWRAEQRKGARIVTPEPHLNDLYAAHLSHVQVTDFAMPDDPHLINTSVGSSTYGNFSNESCMIIQELQQRGLLDEARRRLEIWLKYQGTAELLGNFTDYDGIFYGAGGFEMGHTYNQHHGWILWGLAEYYFAARDREWLERIADQLIRGADWVFRQRRNTMTDALFSRGWEYGFLPAGSLEDVADFYHWLSTNSVTWRGTDSVARALEAIGHKDAERIRKESDNYRRDLKNSFEKMRQHSPLARLRNGKWIPHYPGRLYRRGRDVGWIRETLEGSVYLLISGLYDPNSREAQWILDDYQDNRYMNPPFGYLVQHDDRNWLDFGGFSCQPNLLAGLMPYLDRDEPEIYIWMFLNAWISCYREEISAMVEHPEPVLGFANPAHFKTSDQANAVMWLRYVYVYATESGIYLGRAIPRKWLSDGNRISAEGVNTRYGDVSVEYESSAAGGSITLHASLSLHSDPGEIIARIRHPEKKPIKSVTVNSEDFTKFNAESGDVDITGLKGEFRVEAKY